MCLVSLSTALFPSTLLLKGPPLLIVTLILVILPLKYRPLRTRSKPEIPLVIPFPLPLLPAPDFRPRAVTNLPAHLLGRNTGHSTILPLGGHRIVLGIRWVLKRIGWLAQLCHTLTELGHGTRWES